MAGMKSGYAKIRPRTGLPGAYSRFRAADQQLAPSRLDISGGSGTPTNPNLPGTGGGGSAGWSDTTQKCPRTSIPWWILLLAAAGAVETISLIAQHR